MSFSSSSTSLRTWILIFAIGILIFLLNVDYTAVNLTLIPISDEINTDLNNLQWLLSSYVLTWAAFVIPAGRAADIYGKRKALVTGLIVFMIGSSLTSLGHSIEMLIFGRIVQGLGAAILSAPAWSYIFTTASPEKQGFVMGIILSFAGLGLAIGPTFAGLIINKLSWRWIFYINIPLGIFVISVLFLYGTKDILSEIKLKIDYIGSLLLASGLCIFFYALNDFKNWNFQDLRIWSELVFGIFLIGCYILRERNQKMRTIPSQLFRNKIYMAAILGELFIAMDFSMVLILMGLYLQNTLHYSSFETGLIFISMTISMGFLSPIGGKMIDTFGIRAPMIFGALCIAFGFGLMAFLETNSSLFYVILSLFIVGTGFGAYFTSCSTAMMRSAPSEDLNVASGVFMMFAMVGNTLGLILSTSFIVLLGTNHLFENILNVGISLSEGQHQNLVGIISKVDHSVSQLKDFPLNQASQLLSLIDEAFVYGLSLIMMFGAFIALVSAILTIWGISCLKKPESKTLAVVEV